MGGHPRSGILLHVAVGHCRALTIGIGGHPLACASRRTALKVLIEERMVENAAETGAFFKQGPGSSQSAKIKTRSSQRRPRVPPEQPARTGAGQYAHQWLIVKLL
jgi:acetylornithine/succinyldiaminopimelate/putrescine aminotransferase